MIKFLKKNQIFILCVLGSIVRLLYGYIYEPWLQAPDHLAWELILEQRNFNYDHLIHYPHEGGTFLISLLSQVIQLFTSFSSLTISAFLLDFVIRFVQITVVKKVFNTKITTLFGIWTVLAAPSMIPWGTVNFGLHAIASVFPFLLLLLFSYKKSSVYHHLFCGAFLGIAVWFSYNNIILIPVFFIYHLLCQTEIKKWMFSVIGLVSVLSLHLLVRQFFDAGFYLNELGLSSIRGVDFSTSGMRLLRRLANLPNVVANSGMALPDSNLFMIEIKLLYCLISLVACINFSILYKKRHFEKSTYMMILIVIFFLILYVISPFYGTGDKGNFILFRHLSYILPLISLLIIISLSSIKYRIIVIVFLILGIYRSGLLFTTEIMSKNNQITKATGWILGTKLGHNRKKIQAILDDNEEKQVLLSQGVGWGISTSLLYDYNTLNKEEADSKVIKLMELVSEYPKLYQNNIFEGIKFSFNKELTPKLNPDLLIKIEEQFNRNYNE